MANGNDSVRTRYVRESDLYREATPEEPLLAARQAIAMRFRHEAALNSPRLVPEYLRITFATLEHEMFRGTLDSAAVLPREVLKEVLKYNAAAAILVQSSRKSRW